MANAAKNTARNAPAANAGKPAAPAPVAPPATPATPAAPATAPQGPLAWQNPQHAAGQKAATAALQSMATQGAYLVRLPATASKLQSLLAGHAGNALPVAALPALVGASAHGWAAFNLGYLAGANASYAACAAHVGVKKAKANPAFCYALPCGTLLTAAGNPWAAPVAGVAPAHAVAAYAQAVAAVKAAQNSGCLPAPVAAAAA